MGSRPRSSLRRRPGVPQFPRTLAGRQTRPRPRRGWPPLPVLAPRQCGCPAVPVVGEAPVGWGVAGPPPAPPWPQGMVQAQAGPAPGAVPRQNHPGGGGTQWDQLSDWVAAGGAPPPRWLWGRSRRTALWERAGGAPVLPPASLILGMGLGVPWGWWVNCASVSPWPSPVGDPGIQGGMQEDWGAMEGPCAAIPSSHASVPTAGPPLPDVLQLRGPKADPAGLSGGAESPPGVQPGAPPAPWVLCRGSGGVGAAEEPLVPHPAPRVLCALPPAWGNVAFVPQMESARRHGDSPGDPLAPPPRHSPPTSEVASPGSPCGVSRGALGTVAGDTGVSAGPPHAQHCV